MSESQKGRITSDETKLKLSVALKGRIVSDETREKMRKAHKRRKLMLEECIKAEHSKISTKTAHTDD